MSTGCTAANLILMLKTCPCSLKLTTQVIVLWWDTFFTAVMIFVSSVLVVVQQTLCLFIPSDSRSRQRPRYYSTCMYKLNTTCITGANKNNYHSIGQILMFMWNWRWMNATPGVSSIFLRDEAKGSCHFVISRCININI